MNSTRTLLSRSVGIGARMALAVAATFLLTVAPARAEASPAVQQVVVRYADLDLGTAQGAGVLYRRIVAAARKVCRDDGSRDLREAARMRACRREAVARAVAATGSARLAAVHSQRYPNG